MNTRTTFARILLDPERADLRTHTQLLELIESLTGGRYSHWVPPYARYAEASGILDLRFGSTKNVEFSLALEELGHTSSHDVWIREADEGGWSDSISHLNVDMPAQTTCLYRVDEVAWGTDERAPSPEWSRREGGWVLGVNARYESCNDYGDLSAQLDRIDALELGAGAEGALASSDTPRWATRDAVTDSIDKAIMGHGVTTLSFRGVVTAAYGSFAELRAAYPGALWGEDAERLYEPDEPVGLVMDTWHNCAHLAYVQHFENHLNRMSGAPTTR